MPRLWRQTEAYASCSGGGADAKHIFTVAGQRPMANLRQRTLSARDTDSPGRCAFQQCVWALAKTASCTGDPSHPIRQVGQGAGSAFGGQVECHVWEILGQPHVGCACMPFHPF